MAYDFAKRKKKRKKPRKQELSSRPAWFGTGLASGLFIAFLLQLGNIYFVSPQDNDTQPDKARQAARPAAQSQPVTEAVTVKPASTRARFEFYDALQQQDSEVDQRSKDAYQTRNETGRTISSYLLQAGSFTTQRDADSRRATVTLLDLPAKVEVGTLASGASAYRVFVGPYSNQSDMAQARAQLHEQGIETLLMAKR